jgi:hypothetical protein
MECKQPPRFFPSGGKGRARHLASDHDRNGLRNDRLGQNGRRSTGEAIRKKGNKARLILRRSSETDFAIRSR